MTNWKLLAEKALQGKEITDEEAYAVLECPNEELLELLQSAYRVRRHYFGNQVKLNMIINTKSGLCPENCGYCAQSRDSSAPIEKYRMMDRDTIIEGAEEIKSKYDMKICACLELLKPEQALRLKTAEVAATTIISIPLNSIMKTSRQAIPTRIA